MSLSGLRSPVYCAESIDWDRDYSGLSLGDLYAMSEQELASVDPLAINLIVAKEIPRLAELDIAHYQRQVNRWTDDFRRRCLPYWETFFHEAPGDFRNDIDYFRLGMVVQYLDHELGIKYKLDQRHSPQILYVDAADLFLNGVIDTLEGTCGNMATLHVAIGWRMGWPVSLACVDNHYILRYDDGHKTWNIEATDTGRGGWSSRPDAQYIEEHDLPPKAIECGSDMRAVSKRELLGLFIGLRARHLQDCGKAFRQLARFADAERDWLLARHLFPTSRHMYRQSMGHAVLHGEDRFDPDERGHPISLASFITETYTQSPPRLSRRPRPQSIAESFVQLVSSDYGS